MNTNEADVTTLILRFRDLVTAPGETLSLHRDLCIARGLTWWGWWNRADERVPYSLFVRLKFLAVTSKPTRIYLFDTRTEAFHEANCEDIHFAATPLSPQLSPDPSATPEYYRQQKYLAWFKLQAISAQPIPMSEVIGRYSYVAVPEFFQRGRKDDQRFHNKIVASVRELKRQGRTIFFLKEAESTHSIQEVVTRAIPQVFLCHSSRDKEKVRNLYYQLKKDQIAPWLDEENLLPGQNWEFEIRKAVRDSDVVVVCLSKSSVNKRGFIQKEIRFALDAAHEQPENTIFLIPLRLEECDVPESLRSYQWVSIYEYKGYDKLLRSLRNVQKTPRVTDENN